MALQTELTDSGDSNLHLQPKIISSYFKYRQQLAMACVISVTLICPELIDRRVVEGIKKQKRKSVGRPLCTRHALAINMIKHIYVCGKYFPNPHDYYYCFR